MSAATDFLHVFADVDPATREARRREGRFPEVTDYRYRWAFVRSNGVEMAVSPHGYDVVSGARRAFQIVTGHDVGRAPRYQLEQCRVHAGHICQVWEVPARTVVPEQRRAPA